MGDFLCSLQQCENDWIFDMYVVWCTAQATCHVPNDILIVVSIRDVVICDMGSGISCGIVAPCGMQVRA
jgi:hypothetical protein